MSELPPRSLAGEPPAQGLYDPAYEHDSCGVGFIVHIKGHKSHQIVRDALQMLENMEHRGACGCEVNTGDGAGILVQMPDKFLRREMAKADINLPPAGHYGVASVFLPRDAAERKTCELGLEEAVRAEGQTVLGWREVPTDGQLADVGPSAKAVEPVMKHLFVGRNPALKDDLAFERKLYVIRHVASNKLRYTGPRFAAKDTLFFVTSFSARTLIYKGMLTATQLENYFPDLRDKEFESALAQVHSRFSTNTFPAWFRAHPNRYMSHNGEINTLRGNVNWMHARQAQITGGEFAADMKKILPIIQEDGSDSGMFDNCLEFLVLSGRALPHAVMMMIPEPWENHESMSKEKRAFYEYHACMMEPWDGPASISFTDGVCIGAVLDRNGLRPSRYYVTKDDRVIMASEVGVVEVDPANVAAKGRLQPGRMFFVDTKQGRIVDDAEIKDTFAKALPYGEWLDKYRLKIEDLPAGEAHGVDHATVFLRQKAFGYTYEDLRFLLTPMGKDGVQPLGSMGTDIPLAVLSNQSKLLYNYFKQLFAQVTNPPIDSIREAVITASETFLGTQLNLVEPKPESCRRIKLHDPIIDNTTLSKLRHIKREGFQAADLPILFEPELGGKGLASALDALFASADAAIARGANLLVLSDRGIDKKHAGIPALLATAGLHHHLIRKGTRTLVSLIVESGEPREVHHFALLFSYGADVINPYLAFETLYDLIHDGKLSVDYEKACKNFIKAGVKSVIKTMAKMGVSTYASYRGAQVFEAIGINHDVVDKYFHRTASRIEGIDLDVIAGEVMMRHRHAFPPLEGEDHSALEAGGVYQWRAEGEFHLWNPQSIHKLQKATRVNDFVIFKEYTKLIDEQSRNLCTLRGMFEFKFAEKPIPLEEVESVEAIVQRFKTGAMSYGSISKEAHEALAIAMNRLGGKSNTGEGGEDPARYQLEANGDSKNSAIKQVASGRFGVTSYYLVNAQELQIKMAQGAKPGEGGELPGHKVYPPIAKVRGTTPGVGLISPPPHHDIYSIEDLAQLIHDLKNANHNARINVKLVAEIGVGTIAAGVAKGKADVILISGHDGGTGASPLSSIQHAGAPWELGVAETNQTLLLNNLRSRVVVETDGQLKTGRDVAIATLLGAEEYGFATAPLVTLGCLMMRVCHLNTCPVGIATQDPRLRAKYNGDPEYAVRFMRFIAQELREYMAKLGFRTINEMVGRVDKLAVNKAVDHWKAKGLDFSKILYRPNVGPEVGTYCQSAQDHGLELSLDQTHLLKICAPALERGERVVAHLKSKNTNRVVGTMVGSELTRRYGPAGLPDDTIQLNFTGSAGQSLGASMPRGITIRIEGDANDYVGKGLSGGRIIITPPKTSTFDPSVNMIIGNVALYGATAGEVFIYGMAGERFCVRNSGALAVVESVGDHCCEYMTSGTVVVLGPAGRNFAAGMSGGIAYVLDEDGQFGTHLNREMVNLYRLIECEDAEIAEVKTHIERHAQLTGSAKAKRILTGWNDYLPKFAKVFPKDYERMLTQIKKVELQGFTGEQALLAAFEANAKDLSRVGGN
ncbi:MAG TPA: glutamate synthase large subunit [Opitutales bacterium]|nr:glutamate synthase large subunit [Opitutales bacterium]